jgi:hypothetical protein
MSQEIEATRAELARDVDRLALRADPRRWLGRVMGSARSAKDRTIKASEETASALADASSGLAHRAHDVGDALRQAPGTVARATGENPVGVGLIAFGGGVLAAALIPETGAERRAVHQLSQQAGPAVEPIRASGQALASDVGQTIGAASEHVRAAAVDAADHVRSAAAQGAAGVRAAANEAMGQSATDARDISRGGTGSR